MIIPLNGLDSLAFSTENQNLSIRFVTSPDVNKVYDDRRTNELRKKLVVPFLMDEDGEEWALPYTLNIWYKGVRFVSEDTTIKELTPDNISRCSLETR